MKVLVDILHPAHVHFFRNALYGLVHAGHEVLVTARDKDITLRLLDLYGIEYECISREASTRGGLMKELLARNFRMARLVRGRRPDVLTSIGGISTAQVGFLTRTRNLIFYDTENAGLSNFLSYPFATEVHTPDCYRGPVRGRHRTYAGYHELAYLHPRRFAADPLLLERYGVDPEGPYSVVRFVSWRAVHDVTARGFGDDEKIKLVKRLSEYGRVFITSETPLPEAFEPYRLPLPPDKIHHLLSFASVFVGESATMASESVILGTPAVYLDVVGRGYTDEQESRYGLCFNFRPSEARAASLKAEEILRDGLKGSRGFREGRNRLLADKIDVTDYIIEQLTRGKGEG